MTYTELLDLLCEKLTTESRALLFTIKQNSMNKKQLWEAANLSYLKLQQEKKVPEPKRLIASRYSLDLNMARLEGAGLVDVKYMGAVAVYTITKLGQDLLSHFLQNRTKQQSY